MRCKWNLKLRNAADVDSNSNGDQIDDKQQINKYISA